MRDALGPREREEQRRHQGPDREAPDPVDRDRARRCSASRPSASIATSRISNSPSTVRGSSSKCHATPAPAMIISRSTTGSRIAPEPAVLPGDPREDAIEVVAPGHAGVEHGGGRRVPVAGSQREHDEEHEPDDARVADEIRDRPRAQRAARQGRRWRRRGAIQARRRRRPRRWAPSVMAQRRGAPEPRARDRRAGPARARPRRAGAAPRPLRARACGARRRAAAGTRGAPHP